MIKKVILSLLLLTLCLAVPGSAKTIVWVTEAGRDDDADGRNDAQDWADKLTAAGYTVDFRPGNWAVLTDTLAAELNAADLVVVSCTTQSGTYATDAAEIALWNSLTTPVMLTSPYIARSNRWQWINNGDGTLPNNNGDQGSPLMQVVKTDHPIFYGVTLDASDQFQPLDPNVGSGNASFLASTDPGNGTLLAKAVKTSLIPDNYSWIIEWKKGTKFYAASTYTPAGDRMYFTGIGYHEVSGSQPMRAYNLTDQGWKLFSNAVKYMLGETLTPATMASNQYPSDQQTDVPLDAIMTWTPGTTAQGHDVYFGTSLADVNNASRANPLGVLAKQGQDANNFDPTLVPGTTYYWRVDEVGETAQGVVWSFTTEPAGYRISSITATASASAKGSSAQSTVDESGLVGDLHDTLSAGMWSSGKNPAKPVTLQYDFDKTYKLYQMLVWNSNGDYESSLNFGLQDVTVEYSADGTTFTKLGDYVFAQGDSAPDYQYNTVVDLQGVAAKSVKLTANTNYGGAQYGLAEVRFLYIPVWAREPKPDSNTTGIDPTGLTLKWRSGREAVSHNVLIGTDPNALTAAGSSPTNSFTPATLNLGTKYYWRVDEVNPATTPTTWAGEVWFFTTPDFLVVDDFEKYSDKEGAAVFNVWTDGFGTSTNAGTVGYNNPTAGTYNDTATVHGGRQSMPFIYGQNGTGAATSEVSLAFKTPQDFTRAGVTTLTFWFYGAPDNGAASLYVKLNDGAAIAYKGNAADLQRHRWSPANFDLTAVATAKSVNKLTIGLTNGASKGTLLIDDIRLYRVAPAVAAPVNPGTTGLIAFYAMENNAKDGSGKGNDGTLVGTPTFVTGQTGMALKLNGTTDCVDLGKKDVFNPTGSFSISVWANIGAWGTAWGHVMASNRGEDSVGWQLRRGNGTGFCFTTRGVGNDDMTTAKAPLQNEWVNFTCVYDNVANTKTIYINGLEDSVVTTTAGATIKATTHNAYLGVRALAANTGPDTTAGTFFTGMLDEIRIFNRALTAGEAAYLYGDR